MSAGRIENADESKAADSGKRRTFFIPLLFFALGVLSAYGYFRWYAGPSAGRMQMESSGIPEQAQAKKQPRILYYVDPMNPANKSDKPGKAPCGMDMVPVYDEEQAGAGKNLPAGTVKISPEKQQTIGVKMSEAAEMEISKTIRAVGLASYDETRVAHVHTKFPGWVDKVYVDFVGKLVKKGQPLLSIYSPDLVSTEQELLIAKKSRDILKSSAFGEIGSRSESLYAATRERLKYWDISDAQIDRIERLGTPLKTLTLYSDLDGFVVARNVYAGQQVAPETDLFVVADLSNIWIQAEVYEYEIQSVSLGQKALVSFPSFPGKTFTGKVTYISPEMDPKTRTLKIRVELANPDFKIKPDMYANVELKLDYGKKLSIPQEAVLDSGASQMVFVAREGGYFEPRRITAGPRVDGRLIVLDGLKAGEQVVTSANFLIDSESQLKSAAGSMEAR
ncbi:MAG TPA: efflux RND transporter periplasmic adaptor subunit [Syntrophobacteraceae bacterium]|nr:efflux RND transporter periplasmic adaptor subunit [Syntrophobacteraceae bacterium]